jgi:hypothetical protein
MLLLALEHTIQYKAEARKLIQQWQACAKKKALPAKVVILEVRGST